MFGYMVTHRHLGPRRPAARTRVQGFDWFVGKGHDTFGPMGPWIVPEGDGLDVPVDRQRVAGSSLSP